MVAERFWIRAIFGMGRGGCVWGVVWGGVKKLRHQVKKDV